MCLLILIRRPAAEYPLVVASNRDEARNRQTAPPGLYVGERKRMLSPRDRVAGALVSYERGSSRVTDVEAGSGAGVFAALVPRHEAVHEVGFAQATRRQEGVAERQGDLEGALRLYQESLTIDPNYIPAILNLASVRMNSGELGAAEELFRRAVSLAPDSYEAYNGLGIALARQGRNDESEAAFRKALEIDPNLEAARDNLRALGKTP